MILRLTAALLAAGTTCSLASADVAPSANPKTARHTYARPAVQDKADPKSTLLQQKLAALGGAPSQMAQGGGLQPGAPGGVPGILALNGSDNCATPDAIAGAGSFFFDNSLATTGTQGQTEALCLAYGFTSIENDVWFLWTAPSSGTATMSLCGGTGMDSKIAAYPPAGCPIPGSALACNDDACAFQSSISFPCASGSNYLLQLGNYQGASGVFGSFTMGVVAGAPPNDDCAAALPINGFGPFVFDSTGATTSAQQSGTCPQAGQDIWFDWTASATGTATVALCGSSYDTIVAVYGSAGCPGGGTTFCNDDSCALQSQTAFPCISGATYAIQIGGYNAGSGPGAFTVNIVPGAPNDSCTAAIAVAGNGTFPFDNSAATTGSQGQNEGLCLAFGTMVISNDVWFAWTAPGSGQATMTLCGLSGLDTKIAAYAGAGCPLPGSALACNDDTCGLESEIVFPVTGGSTYMLQIGCYAGTLGGAGSFSIDVPAGGSISYLCDPGASGVIPCPCSNPPSGSGRGCDNSSGTGGASITGAGSTTLANPTLFFTTAGEKPTATTILLQGGASLPAGVAFGQGVRCVGGTLKRLYVKTAVGGSITAPNFGAGDLDIPTRSSNLGDPISAGQSRWYMAYYRDPIVLGGCSALATFNTTSAAAVQWQ